MVSAGPAAGPAPGPRPVLRPCLCACSQVVEGNSLPLGPDAVRSDQHPDVSSGFTLDARCLPSLYPPRSTAGFCRAACGGGTPV